MQKIYAGLIGLGTVGKSVVKLWPRAKGLVLKKVADKDRNTKRGVKLEKGVFTARAEDILNDPEIDIVIELIGGVEAAYEYIKKSLERGKNVVTANKALLALRGEELEKIARANGVYLAYEASVCAGIPIIRSIREGLIANKIKSIYGIINGTTNFILSAMEEKGLDFEAALSRAQAQGFAERNAFLDIDGLDSQHKLAILVRLAFKTGVRLADIYVEGIRKITSRDITYASELGYRIKLLAIAKEGEGGLEARVHPTLIPKDNLLSSVRGIHNACFVEGDACGKMVFYGQGAGGFPTASAILSDCLDIARCLREGRKESFSVSVNKKTRLKKIDELLTRYYLRFFVIDKPGVFAQISGILGRCGISIASVIQKERGGSKVVPIVIMTHEAKEFNMRRAMRAINALKVVKPKSFFIRVEEFED